ncbi:MAG: exodeoxyribonuclease VII small subunit [Negativicutes bacterium]|jgi:exodeoxyribonuclease VII small subunit
MKKKAELNIEALQYEQAYAALEDAAKALDSGEVTVDEALEKFERGMVAAKRCMKLLDNAEQKMDLLVSEYSGKIVFEKLAITEDR